MRSDEAGRWLEQAHDDLKWARMLEREGGHNVACFMAQQVAEKALKALLYAAGAEVVLGHSVRRLCDSAASRYPELAAHCERWGFLDGYYVTTRYPNSLPGSIPARVFDRASAQDAVARAAEVVAAAESAIPTDSDAGPSDKPQD